MKTLYWSIIRYILYYKVFLSYVYIVLLPYSLSQIIVVYLGQKQINSMNSIPSMHLWFNITPVSTKALPPDNE